MYNIYIYIHILGVSFQKHASLLAEADGLRTPRAADVRHPPRRDRLSDSYNLCTIAYYHYHYYYYYLSVYKLLNKKRMASPASRSAQRASNSAHSGNIRETIYSYNICLVIALII